MQAQSLQLLEILLAARGLRGVPKKILVHFEKAHILEPVVLAVPSLERKGWARSLTFFNSRHEDGPAEIGEQTGFRIPLCTISGGLAAVVCAWIQGRDLTRYPKP